MNQRHFLAILFLLCGGATAFSQPSAEDLPDGLLKDVPVQVMEFHIWWETPYQGLEETREWSKWVWSGSVADPERATGPAWRRRLSPSGYPLIGPYNSSDTEVMRWQLRCAKAAGIDALQIQMFSDLKEGLTFGLEPVFARLLDVAAAEGMPVYIHDEVQFREGASQNREVMEKRVTAILKKYGSHPGYYKWNGKPAYSFQYWSRFMPVDQLALMMRHVNEAIPDGVYFVVNGGATEDLRKIPEVGSLIGTANSNHLKDTADRSTSIDWGGLDQRLADVRAQRKDGPQKPIGLWAYPGFDASGQQAGQGKWLSRGENLSYFKEVLRRYAAQKPDFILISSWNDWIEGTAIEPSLDVDGRKNDPYEALRLIARLKGKKFEPPPLPPFEDIDPWMNAPLKGPDKTPPYPVNAWFAANAGEARAGFVDETSAVADAQIAREPSAYMQCYGAKLVSYNATFLNPPRTVGMTKVFTGIRLNDSILLRLRKGSGWTRGEAGYLVVVYQGVDGCLKADYTGTLPDRRDLTDGFVYPKCQPVMLGGRAGWKTVVRKLDGIDPGGDIRIFWESWGAASNKAPLIAGVYLFREADFKGDDVFDAGGSEGGGAKTFRFEKVAWDPKLPKPVLIRGSDIHQNRSFPVALAPGLVRDALLQPYPLD